MTRIDISYSFRGLFDRHYMRALKHAPYISAATRYQARGLRARAVLQTALLSVADEVGFDWGVIAGMSYNGRPLDVAIDTVMAAWNGFPPKEDMLERMEEVVALYDNGRFPLLVDIKQFIVDGMKAQKVRQLAAARDYQRRKREERLAILEQAALSNPL